MVLADAKHIIWQMGNKGRQISVLLDSLVYNRSKEADTQFCDHQHMNVGEAVQESREAQTGK